VVIAANLNLKDGVEVQVGKAAATPATKETSGGNEQ